MMAFGQLLDHDMLENSTPRSELSKEDNVGIYMQMVL
jgi:hypothetical protein